MSVTDADREKTSLTDTIIALFKGPYPLVNRLKHYVINGLKFRSLNVEANRKMVKANRKTVKANRKTQNNGVSVATKGGIMFYSVLTDIIELNYFGNIRHVLFKCKWVDDQNRRGYKTDEFGFLMVNFTHSIYGGEEIVDEPYVLASQTTQVFYVEDKRYKDWYVVVKTKARDVFDAGISPYCDEDDTFGFYDNISYSVTGNDASRENLR